MRVARTLWSSAAQAQDEAGTATLPKVAQISDGNRPSWGPHGGREGSPLGLPVARCTDYSGASTRSMNQFPRGPGGS